MWEIIKFLCQPPKIGMSILEILTGYFTAYLAFDSNSPALGWFIIVMTSIAIIITVTSNV